MFKKKLIALFMSVALLGTTVIYPANVYAREMNETSNMSEENEATTNNSVEDSVNDNVENSVNNSIENSADDQSDLDSSEQDELIEDEEQENTEPGVEYQAHVQSIGWQQSVADGSTAGTLGKALRLEALKVNLTNAEDSHIKYSAYVQSYGWQDGVSDGIEAGTVGKAKRIEAMKINLSGPIAETYDVYYRAYVQSYGWLGWTSNNGIAGTMDYAKRLEAIEIKLVKKGEEAPDMSGASYKYPKIRYQSHVQTYGWLDSVSDDQIAGTVGKGKRMETLKISLADSDYLGYEGGIRYRTYVQSFGWQDWVNDGQQAGTVGMAKRIEAIQIELTGDIANYYDVYYSVHMAKIGWVNYASNGDIAGTAGLSKPIEAVKVRLVKKGEEVAPDTSGVKFVQGYANDDLTYSGTIKGGSVLESVKQGTVLGTMGKSQALSNMTLHLNRTNDEMPQGTIKYMTHVSGIGWTEWSENGNRSGSVDASKGIEALKVSLSGEISKYYDIYYRAYVQQYGWLGWAKNGQAAGTTKIGYRLEAVQIKLVSKDASAPGANSGYYTEQKKYTIPPLPLDQRTMLLKANTYGSSTNWLILVDTRTNRVGVYYGSQGRWNQMKYMLCTSGKASTPTVKGTFTVKGRGKSFGSGYTCWYYTQFYGNYLFHSVLYRQGSMTQIKDGRLGINASHGCVRLELSNAKWIYDTIPSGTKVVIY